MLHSLTRGIWRRGVGAASGAVQHSGARSLSTMSQKQVLKGVVFDMDGTVTVPCIDFAEMRRRCGVTQGDILDVINSYPPEQKAAAYRAIQEIEDEALLNMRVMPGAVGLCSLLDGARVPRGLITRNVMRSVQHFHTHHITAQGVLPFEPSITRECNFAYKPSPEALLHICSTWDVPPDQVMMVGDSVKDDIVCGNRAGAITCLIDFQGQFGYRGKEAELEGERRPTHIVHSLGELAQLLQDRYQLEPPPNPHAAVEPMQRLGAEGRG